jgi:hypothetical protein
MVKVFESQGEFENVVSMRTFYDSHPGMGDVSALDLRLAVAQIRASLCKNSISAFLDMSSHGDVNL